MTAFPNAFCREPDFSQKNLGNFLSRSFGNILFPFTTQYWHSGLASSHFVSDKETFRNSWTLPKWKLINSSKKSFVWRGIETEKIICFKAESKSKNIVKILNHFIIILCTHLYHFFLVSIHYCVICVLWWLK